MSDTNLDPTPATDNFDNEDENVSLEDLGFEFTEEALPDDHKSGFVAVVGRPNVGKSTLMNAFLQQKLAIVTPRPQTTRTRQLGIITKDDHQIIFMDTPGLMKPRHKLDEFMVETAVEALDDADIILWLVDASEPVGPGDQDIATQLKALDKNKPIILAINKIDTLNFDEVIPTTEAYRALLPEAKWLVFSAQANRGTDELYELLLDHLPLGPRYYPADQITDTYIRDIAAEMIREQLLLQLNDEIPYGTAVTVTEFKERENGVIYINATIYVERDNHKKIVIGHKGKKLRQLGAAARQEIEELVNTRVYLELWVKAAPKWRRKEDALRRFGYAKE
ncbi:MAG TPA: GTPase Era [Anaerolineae bacterium]|nr:GTPase Era [Anaerolineae bacterium]